MAAPRVARDAADREPASADAPRGRHPVPGLFAAAAILGVVAALYGRALGVWWNHDDLYLVHVAATHSPAEYFFSPALWRALPHRTFFPLLLASYRADLALFGARPVAFYAHELLAVAAACGAFFLALKQWLSAGFSAAGTLLFALGTPLVLWSQQAMHRHYAEGFALATLALVLHVDGLRHEKPGRALASAWLYLLAMLAKEVYVPIPAVFLLIPEGRLPIRLRALRAHAAVLLLYIAWRAVSLGTLVGGYGWAIPARDLPRALLALPARVIRSLFAGPRAAVLLVAVALLAALVYALRDRWGWLAAALAGTALALAPAAAVATTADARFATPLWAIGAAAVAAAGARLAARPERRRLAAAFVSAATLAAFFSNRAAWRSGEAGIARMSAEGRAFLDLSPGDLLRHPATPSAAMQETRWFREEYLGRPRGAEWFADDVFLCGRAASGRIWEFDESSGRVADVTSAVRSGLSAFCAGWRRDAPLSVEFERRGDAVFWRLGPYTDGHWALLFGGGRSATPVHAADGYRFASPRGALMVRYQAPSGWLTYSPELVLDFRSGNGFRWTRAHEPQ